MAPREQGEGVLWGTAELGREPREVMGTQGRSATRMGHNLIGSRGMRMHSAQGGVDAAKRCQRGGMRQHAAALTLFLLLSQPCRLARIWLSMACTQSSRSSDVEASKSHVWPVRDTMMNSKGSSGSAKQRRWHRQGCALWGAGMAGTALSPGEAWGRHTGRSQGSKLAQCCCYTAPSGHTASATHQQLQPCSLLPWAANAVGL